MATSSYMNTSNSYVKYTISITENSYDIASNSSNVRVQVMFFRTNTGYTTYGSGTVYCKIDGTTYSASVTPSQGITYNGIYLFDKTLTIYHDSDGSKKLTCSAWIKHERVNSSEQIYSQSLITIPRASDFGSISGGTIGSSMTININRHSSSFVHQVWYRFGNTGWVELGDNFSTSCTFTPPMSLCNQIPDSTYGTFDLCIRTLQNGRQIGDDVYKSITIYIPSTLSPTLSFTISDGGNYANTYGAYIQGISTVKTVVSASGAYGSTIENCYVTIDGKTYSGVSTISGTLSSSGNVSVYVEVYDSRGRKTVQSKNISVLEYGKPKVPYFITKRCDSNGSLNGSGTHLIVMFKSEITPLNNKNKAVYSLKYKKTSESTFTTVQLTNYNGKYSITNGSHVFSADRSSSYDVELSISDAFTSYVVKGSGSSVHKLISLLNKGLGIAFGKVAERQNEVEFGMSARFDIDVRGSAYGLNGLDQIKAADDINNYLSAGRYGISENVTAEKIKNLPVGEAGVLTVSSSNGMTLNDSTWRYIRQEYRPLSSSHPTYTRDIAIPSNGKVYIDPWLSDGQKILWKGAAYMRDGQSASLSEKITQQKNGIVLVFSAFNNDTGMVDDSSFFNFFIPKIFVQMHAGKGVNFNMNGMWNNTLKYLYISDNVINGNSWNDDTFTMGGITYNCNRSVLRYVIGV